MTMAKNPEPPPEKPDNTRVGGNPKAPARTDIPNPLTGRPTPV